RSSLNSPGGDENHIPLCVDQQARIDELIRKEGIVVIWKDGFEANRAGIHIDFVVDRQQRARSNFPFEIAVPRIHLETLAGVNLLSCFRNCFFANIEDTNY